MLYFTFGMGLLSGGLGMSFSGMFLCYFLVGSLFFYPDTRKSLYFPKCNEKLWKSIKDYLSKGIPCMLTSALYIVGVEIM